MTVGIGEAKTRLAQLIRAAEGGETIFITRRGRAVAQLGPVASAKREVLLGGMRDRIKLLPGWDAPVDLGRFLEGEL